MELTILRQQYEKVFAERVTAVHETALAELDAKFTTALDSAIAQAKSTGDLPTVLALQADQKLLSEKKPLPAEDALDTPEPLKNLRVIYREQLAKLTEQRDANTTALQAPYAARLQELEATLTKNDHVEEAKAVMDYRIGLAKAIPTAPTAAVVPAATATAPTATMPAPTTARVKGDDRKAAEWVLSVGGKLGLVEGGSEFTKTDLGNLPKGRFNIRYIVLDNNGGGIKPFTDADFVVLSGLERLERIMLNKLAITPAAFDTLANCPNLQEIQMQYNQMGDELWRHLAGIRNLARLAQTYDALPIQGLGIGNLNPATLTKLFLGSCPITDAGLAEMAAFPKLEYLNIEGSKITDEGMKALAPLRALKTLHVHGTAVSGTGLSALKECPLVNLGCGRTTAEMLVVITEVASIFPDLRELRLPRESIPTAEDWAGFAQAIPGLTRIEVDSHKWADDSCIGLDVFPELESLHLRYAPVTDAGVEHIAKSKNLRILAIPDAKITDTALVTLANLKKLKTLTLPKTGNGITDAGIAAFKKARPDVKVE